MSIAMSKEWNGSPKKWKRKQTGCEYLVWLHLSVSVLSKQSSCFLFENQAMHSSQDQDMDMDGPVETDKESHTTDETDSDSGGSDSEAGGKCLVIQSTVTHCLDVDIDDEEADRLKGEMITEMTDLEKQFLALREQLYYERLNRVEEKLNQVKAGKSSDYMQPLEELEENLKVRTEVVGIQRDLRIANVTCIYEAEKVAAKQTMEMECRVISESIRQDLEEKLRRLEEDRNSLDSELWAEASLSGKKKKRYLHTSMDCMVRDQLNLPDRRRKPVTVSGPFVVYMLRETDILEDCNLIRRASRSSFSSTYF